MLSQSEIKELHEFLLEDIKDLELSGDQIPQRVNFYLENIGGLETISDEQYEQLIQKIIDGPDTLHRDI